MNKEQVEYAEKIVAEKGIKALYDPHALTGKICGCKDCFCCAALMVYTRHMDNKERCHETEGR